MTRREAAVARARAAGDMQAARSLAELEAHSSPALAAHASRLAGTYIGIAVRALHDAADAECDASRPCGDCADCDIDAEDDAPTRAELEASDAEDYAREASRMAWSR